MNTGVQDQCNEMGRLMVFRLINPSAISQGNALTGLVTTETNIQVCDDSQVVTANQSEAGQTTALVENIQH